MKTISNSPEETRKIAEEFVGMLKRGEEATVIALIGDLGSGKTSFSQFVGEALGVHDPIQSPTFLIEKIYELKRAEWEHMIHIDAYRLESEQELLDLGWKNIISRPENIILVEWADKVMSILPPHAYHIVLTHVDETKREIEILTRE
ncbi:MAG: tRNA (adenosine(37)-N6)-threonylcarbamoyltransferase complex ATPase subunit type 1 TsaE [Minisyncoccota bacterium]